MLRTLLAVVYLLPRALLAADDAVPQSTEVLGDVPADLAGRWLVVGNVRLPSGKVRPVAVTWEIRSRDGHPELVLQRSPLPVAVHAKVEAAARAGTAWEPDATDRRAVLEGWGKLPPEGDHTQIESKLAAPGAFPKEIAEDDIVKGSALAIVVTEDFTGKEHVARTTSVYGVRERGPGRLGGTFVTTSLAIAFFPVPITLKGDFQAYRVDAEPPRSWLARLFSGCQRP